MTEEQIVRMVNEVFEEFFEIEPDRLLPEATIFDDLELDSLDIVDLVVVMQNTLKVRIRDDERLRSIRTLGDIYQFATDVQREAAAAATQRRD